MKLTVPDSCVKTAGVAEAPCHLEHSRRRFNWVLNFCPLCLGRHRYGAGTVGENVRAFLGPQRAHCTTVPVRQIILVEQDRRLSDRVVEIADVLSGRCR